MITVPDSVAYYWAEPAHRAAVNLLVDRGEVPPDLDLDEVEQFETASLAAQRVRLDFWRLLRRLWSATWGDAVQAELPGARLRNYEAHAAYATDPIIPSVENAWIDRATFGLFEVAGRGKLVTRLMFADKRCRELLLSFYFADLDDRWSISDGLELGPTWLNEDGWRTQRLSVDPQGVGQGGIDLQEAATASRQALALLSHALR